MPVIKTLRDDILRRPEIDAMLRRARDPHMAGLIAMLWLFGKRISEVLALRRKDVWVEGEYLYARFIVLKKVKREYYLKRIREVHPYVKYIVNGITAGLEPDDRIFPMDRCKAWRELKKINKNVYPHFFRESLATSMAERGASMPELMAWFDWTNTDNAMRYVKRGIKLTQKWADREF